MPPAYKSSLTDAHDSTIKFYEFSMHFTSAFYGKLSNLQKILWAHEFHIKTIRIEFMASALLFGMCVCVCMNGWFSNAYSNTYYMKRAISLYLTQRIRRCSWSGDKWCNYYLRIQVLKQVLLWYTEANMHGAVAPFSHNKWLHKYYRCIIANVRCYTKIFRNQFQELLKWGIRQ